MLRVLPPGTWISVPPYVLHRHARNFVILEAFWPERWLVASSQLPLARTFSLTPGLLWVGVAGE